MVDVPEPGAAMELGLKVTVWAFPCPEADKLIAELKPPEMPVVIVDVPELLRATLIDVGDALMVKLGVVPVTVRVMVEVPAPVIEVGLKPTVTPVGWPVADKEMAESKPPVTVLVIVEVPALPCATETEAGEAERLKPGVDDDSQG